MDEEVVPTQKRKLSLPLNLISSKQEGETDPDGNDINSSIDYQPKRLGSLGSLMKYHLQCQFQLDRSFKHREVVEIGKYLCFRYFCLRLIKCGIIDKKIGRQQLRNVYSIKFNPIIVLVDFDLRFLIRELEQANPRLYESVIGNIGHNIFRLSSMTAQEILQTISREIFRNNVTWPKIASFYAIAGALAIDCFKFGHPEYANGLIKMVSFFIDNELATWIVQKGGWVSRYICVTKVIYFNFFYYNCN